MKQRLKGSFAAWGHRLRLLRRGWGLVHRTEPWFLPIAALLGLVKPLGPYVGLYASARILNELLGARRIPVLTGLVLFSIGLSFLLYLLSAWLQSRCYAMSFHSVHHLYQLTGKRFCDMDYDQVNDPSIRAMLGSIQEGWRVNNGGLPMLFYRMPDFFEGFFGVLLSILLLRGMVAPAASILSRLASPWLDAAMVLMMVGLVAALVVMGKKAMIEYTRQNAKMTNPRAFLEHIARYVNVNRAGKDIRIYDQASSIEEMMRETFYASDLMLTTIGKLNINHAAQTAGERLLAGVLYAILGLRALAGMYTAGNVLQYAGALLGLFRYIGDTTVTATALWENIPMLERLYAFLDLPSHRHRGTLNTEKRDDNEYEIEFHHVSFRYPGASDYALKDVNLKFAVGRRLAMVGRNGSGKTTVIKLLCRLYEPTEGFITLNGIDIQKYDDTQYMALFSVVFQDYKLLSLTLRENLGAGAAVSEGRMLDALEKAGFSSRLKTLPQGLDTYLYKSYDEGGVELSGGEAQKIALARALCKDSPFIILDEPTAALDPVAEYEIYRHFDSIVQDRTTVFISHRLSSCRFCDDIAVFDCGQLVQRGSHDGLVSDAAGPYYRLWHAQAQYYENAKGDLVSENT
jgi:ATP-binding cassette subfamily B protein